MRRRTAHSALFGAVLLLAAAAAQAQSVTLPPSGDNQKASVTQYIGLVKVTIDYSSPDVTSPTGEDRTGKIWGQLVPYGMANLGFGTCGDNCPWRAGANENTVFTVSHDVLVEGQSLAAGAYGLHMIAGENEWTIIFSHNSTSWGSFFYDPAEDALRVTVKPQPHSYVHWLTYEFIDRQPDKATVALQWENLQVPFTITVPNTVELYVENLRHELRSSPGFNWQGWDAAAQYALQHGHPAEALAWAQSAVSLPFIGQEGFNTLTTLSLAQAASGQEAASEETFKKAVNHPAASQFDLHQLGRTLIAQGKPEKALEVFETNAKRHPNTWPVNVGLARGHSALGHYEEAIKYAKKALENAPDDGNRRNLESMIKTLEEGKDVN